MRHQQTFACIVEHEDHEVLIRPLGELDCWTVASVEQRLIDARDAGAGRITLDLGALSFLDSSAVALVIRWSRESAEHGFMLDVLGGTGRAQRIFEITACSYLLADAAQAA
jgi:anti-sigma B factor antagonist